MHFPVPFNPDSSTRAGRMMQAGRVKVTGTSMKSGKHITILFKSFADNRQRQYDDTRQSNWIACPLRDATHIFVEVPSASGGWNDKVGTFYPKSGRWYDADNADPQRVWMAQAIAQWLNHPSHAPQNTTFEEASECGVCGKELTDPESISRGIGPVCFGAITGSQHQVKGIQDESMPGEEPPVLSSSKQIVVASAQEDLPRAEAEPLFDPTRQETVKRLLAHAQDENMRDAVEVLLNVNLSNLSDEELQLLAHGIAEETQIRRARVRTEVDRSFMER